MNQALPIFKSIDQRFWSKVSKTKDCWLWLAGKNKGYGIFGLKIVGKHGMRPAHRISYLMKFGHIPEGHDLDHLCRNRSCVNPDHLEPVSRRENVIRGMGITAQNSKKEICLRGHALVGDNLYVRPNGNRKCKRCNALLQNKYNLGEVDNA